MVEGLFYVIKGRSVVLFLTAIASLYTFAASALTTLFPVFAQTLFDRGPVEVGSLWSMLGVGLLSVSLGLTRIDAWNITRRIQIIMLATAVSGIVLLGLVWTTRPVTAGGLLIVLGAGLGVLTPVAWGALQEVTPWHMLGRALSFYTMGAMGAALGGITFFGRVTGRLGVPLTVPPSEWSWEERPY
jgi:MFS transporter, DHA3 family, macrolide efflux protein